MGGSGSGGHNCSGRAALECWASIGIQQFKAGGLLQPGAAARGKVGRISRFEFKTGPNNSLDTKITDKGGTRFQWVDFEQHSRPFGGFQAYFRCPYCGNRRTKLYLYRGEFRCRVCARLQYRSQRMRTADRLAYKAQKVRERMLGVPWTECNGLDGAPDRPKGMHWSTYDRLCKVFDRAYKAWCWRLVSFVSGLERQQRKAQRG